MIVNKAYSGKKFVHRAYYNGQLIWDYGVYSHGNAFATLEASIMPYLRNPDIVQMCVEAIMDGFGIAEVSELETIIAHTDMMLKNKAIPHTSKTIHGAGTGFTTVQVTIAPFTFDIVYGYGDAVIELAAYGYADDATAVHGLGVANVDAAYLLYPTVEDVLRILASFKTNIHGFTIPKLQEPKQIVTDLSSNFVSRCSPANLPLHKVTFMRDGVELYSTKVVHGNDCPDPVATYAITKPTKPMTVQYTYEFSGWSLTDGGDADAGGTVELLEETTLDGFAEQEPGLMGFDTNVENGLVAGETYRVIWGNDEYSCTAVEVEAGAVAIGNFVLGGLEGGNNEPFLMFTMQLDENVYMFAIVTEQEGTSHTVAIYQNTEGALSNITEDTVVYVAFEESIRYYNVYFYDEGELVETVSVPYGSTAVTSYSKKGYKLTGYTPSNENIVADTHINLQFDKFSFSSATWAEISEISERNEAADYFAIGDERVEKINGKAVTLVIVAFNADNKGSGKKAGITIVNKNAYTTSTVRFDGYTNYGSAKIATTVNNLLSSMPSDLQAVIKPVYKGYKKDTTGNYASIKQSVWLLSLREIFPDCTFGHASESYLGKPYDGFVEYPELRCYDGIYWTRTMYQNANYYGIVKTNTANNYTSYTNGYYNNWNLIRFGFCV